MTSSTTGYLWSTYTFVGQGKQSTVDHIYAPAVVQNPDNGGDGPFIGFLYGETVGSFNPNGPDTVVNNVLGLDNFFLPLFGPVTVNNETVQKFPFHYAIQATGSAGPGIGIYETQTGTTTLTHSLNLTYASGGSKGALAFTAPKVIETFANAEIENPIFISDLTAPDPSNSNKQKIDTFSVAWDQYSINSTTHQFSYSIHFQIFHPTLSNTGAVTATTNSSINTVVFSESNVNLPVSNDPGSGVTELPAWHFHAGGDAYMLALAEADPANPGQMLVHFQGYTKTGLKEDGTNSTSNISFDIAPDLASYTGTTITNAITIERNPTTNDLVTSTLQFKQFSGHAGTDVGDASLNNAFAVAWNESVQDDNGNHDQVEFVVRSTGGSINQQTFDPADLTPGDTDPQKIKLITNDDRAILVYGDDAHTYVKVFDVQGHLVAQYDETADHTFDNAVTVGAFLGDDRIAIVYDEPTTGNNTQIISHIVDLRAHALTNADLTNLTTDPHGINNIAGTSLNDGTANHIGDTVIGADFTGQGGNNTYYYVGQQGNPDGAPVVTYTGGANSWNAVIFAGSFADYDNYSNNNGTGAIDGTGNVAGTMNFASTQELVFSPSQSALIDGTSSTIVASAGSHVIILTNFIDPGANTQTYIDLARIMAGATLEIDTAWGNSPIAGTNNIVTFAGAGATLRLDDPANFHAKLAGLAVGNAIDIIDDVTGASINAATKQLTVNTVSDGSFVYNLTSVPTGLNSQLELKDDGHDGALLIVHGTAPVTWKTGVNGDFAAAGNWTPAIVPDQIDNAAITPAGTYKVTSSDDETVKTLVSAAGATLEIANSSTFTILNGTGSGALAGKINIDAGSTLHLHSGPANNSGTMTVADHGTLVIDTDLTVQGGGSIVLGGSQAFIQDPGSTTAFTLGTSTSAETISGVGNIGSGFTVLNIGAKGVINANDPAGGTLTIRAGDWTNLGTLEASKGGALVIAPNVDPTNSGLIEALGGTAASPLHSTVSIQENIGNTGAGSLLASGNGAHIDIEGVTITGGTFKTASGGFIQTTNTAHDTTISGVTNTGDLRVGDSTSLHIQGAVFNNTTAGVLSVRGDSANTTSLVIDNDLTLQGGGKVDLAGDFGTGIITATGHKLTNADNTIFGGGAIGAGNGSLSLTNGVKGVINATDGSNSLGINVAGTILNQGTLESTTGTLFVESDINNNTTKSLIQALGSGAHVNLQNSNIDNTTGTIFASGTGAHVDLSAVTVTNGTFKTATNGVIQTTADNSTITDVTNTGSLTVNGGSTLHVASKAATPVFNNSGIVTINGDGGEADLVFDTDNTTLQGGGKIVLNSAGSADEMLGAVAINNGTATSAHTIMGAGLVGEPGMTLVNGAKGLINGSDVTNALTLDPGSKITNQGILEGTGAAGLDVMVDVDNFKTIQALGAGKAAATVLLEGSTVTNIGTGSLFASGTGAHIDLSGETINGGALKTASGGVINVISNSTFSGVTNAGTLNIGDHQILTVLGTTLNNTATGVININDTLHTVLEIGDGGTFALQGGGKVNMNGIGNAEIVSSGHAVTFVNADNTIAGSGIIGDGNITLSNQIKGVINGNDGSGALTIDTGTNKITNQGILEGTGAAGLDVKVDVDNSKTIQALGAGTAAAAVLLEGSTITNTTAGSVLASGAKAHLDLNNETIIGGKLSTLSGGTINIDGTTTFDSSVVGNVLGVSNAGKMFLADGAELQIKGTETFTGAGTFELSSRESLITADGAPAKFVNSGNTIFGDGNFFDANLTVDNKTGVISVGLRDLVVTNEAKIQDDFISNASVTQSSAGSITATTGHQVTLNGAAGDTAVSNGTLVGAAATSTIEITNAVMLTAVKITNAGEMDLHDGTTTSTGTLANTGYVSIDNENVTIGGAVTNTGTGLVNIGSGFNGLIDVRGDSTVLFSGAVSGTGMVKVEDTSSVEFGNAATTQNVAFSDGTVVLDHSLTFKGTVSGFAPAVSGMTGDFSNFLAFGDSTIDSGWFPTAIVNGDTGNQTGSSVKDTLITNALDKGGTGAPVGFDFMNSQLLANDFGYAAVPADEPGGGTNYAIAGAVTIADAGGTTQNTPADGDTVDPGNGSIGNLNKNGALPSTVQQIDNYLAANGGADAQALYLISTGGNDTTFANDDMPGDTKAQKQAYLMHQAEALADEIGILQAAGAETIVVHSLAGDDPTANSGAGNFATLFDNTLFGALDAAHVHYIKSDVAAMKSAITANPTTFGFTAGTVAIGTAASTTTSSAFIDFDSINNSKGVPTPIQTGWGQWGAPIGYYDGSGSYAYLRAPNAEFTSLYSDDQHFSTQGQQIEADYDLAQIFAAGAAAMDSIDLRDIAYAFGTTTATYAGTKTGGTLTVTDSVHHTTTKLILTGDYTGANFVATTDGHGGTAVIEAAPSASAAADVMFSHLLDAHYAGAIVAGMNYAVLDFTMTKAVTLSGDSTSIVLSSADVIETNGAALTLTNNETIHGGGTIGDAFMTLNNGAAGVIDADDVFGGMTIQTTGHAVANAGTIEALGGGWLRISNTTINDTATAQFKVLGSDGDTSIPSLIDLDHATINGGIVTVGAGAILEAVNGTTSTFSGAVTNAGKLEAFSSSHLTINGAVTGNGFATIGSGGTLEFGAAADTDVTFITFSTGNAGKLMLDHATSATSQFTGTISNFLHGNDIDLGAITYTGGANANNDSQAVFDAVHNQLTVSDTTHSIVLTFDANLTVGTDFHVVNDTHGHVDLLHV